VKTRHSSLGSIAISSFRGISNDDARHRDFNVLAGGHPRLSGGYKTRPYDAKTSVNIDYVAAGFIPALSVGTMRAGQHVGGYKTRPYGT